MTLETIFDANCLQGYIEVDLYKDGNCDPIKIFRGEVNIFCPPALREYEHLEVDYIYPFTYSRGAGILIELVEGE